MSHSADEIRNKKQTSIMTTNNNEIKHQKTTNIEGEDMITIELTSTKQITQKDFDTVSKNRKEIIHHSILDLEDLEANITKNNCIKIPKMQTKKATIACALTSILYIAHALYWQTIAVNTNHHHSIFDEQLQMSLILVMLNIMPCLAFCFKIYNPLISVLVLMYIMLMVYHTLYVWTVGICYKNEYSQICNAVMQYKNVTLLFLAILCFKHLIIFFNFYKLRKRIMNNEQALSKALTLDIQSEFGIAVDDEIEETEEMYEMSMALEDYNLSTRDIINGGRQALSAKEDPAFSFNFDDYIKEINERYGEIEVNKEEELGYYGKSEDSSVKLSINIPTIIGNLPIPIIFEDKKEIKNAEI